MLAIRMQRTGRKGHPMYRMIVQEAHRQPTSGKVVATIGSYNPHTKETTIDSDKASFYLKNGAQPSDRAIRILSSEKVTLPAWVKQPSTDKQKSIKNLDKLRRNKTEEPAQETPAAEVKEVPEETPAPAAAEENPPVDSTESVAATPEEAPEKSE